MPDLVPQRVKNNKKAIDTQCGEKKIALVLDSRLAEWDQAAK